LFDSIRPDDASAQLRNAAALPLGAFLFALLYLTIYPLFDRVPAALFWIVVAIELTGAVAGVAGIIGVVRRERVRGRAIGWLVAALAVTSVCAGLFVSLTVPWL
jgi:hypothetical protein